MEPGHERRPEDAPPDAATPVLELAAGRVTTTDWITSRGQWALFACEVLPQDGASDPELEIRVETKDPGEPDEAATVLLPLRLDRGPWQLRGAGVHGAEFQHPRGMVRLLYLVPAIQAGAARPASIAVRMLPVRWRELRDGFVWVTPWIPFASLREPPQISVARIDGPGLSVQLWITQAREAV